MSEPDIGPSYEWYRELAAERDDPLVMAAARCRQCGYLETAIGHLNSH